MDEIELKRRTKEEKLAYIDGFEQCAGFAYKYMDREGKEKLKYIIRSVKRILMEEYGKKEE